MSGFWAGVAKSPTWEWSEVVFELVQLRAYKCFGQKRARPPPSLLIRTTRVRVLWHRVEDEYVFICYVCVAHADVYVCVSMSACMRVCGHPCKFKGNGFLYPTPSNGSVCLGSERALRRLAMRNKTQGKPERSTRVNIKQCVLFTEKLWVCFLRWETK